MFEKRFDDFYFVEDNDLHSLEEVQYEYDYNDGNINCFKGRMYCPECRMAGLAFHHKTKKKREYLSKLPSSNHKNGCSYINEYASKNAIIEYVKSLDEEQIQDKLESALNMLIPKENTDIKCNDIENKNAVENPLVIKKNIKGKTEYKTIPRKSIYTWFDKQFEGCPALFYGIVRMKIRHVNSKKNAKYYVIEIYKKGIKDGEWKYKTEIFRGTHKDIVDESIEYDFAVIGRLDFSYKNRPQIRTISKNAVLYRKHK